MKDFLKSDCSKCFGLCCVALPYGKSSDFLYNKDAGVPCRNLCSDYRCSIHAELREKGFRGCVSYECFGAGQLVSQNLYQGHDWRNHQELSGEMFDVFTQVQQLHEMLWYLRQALNLKETKPFQSDLKKIYNETVQLTQNTPDEIINLDIAAHRNIVNEFLVKTSEIYRKDVVKTGKKKIKRSNLDYLGANLKGHDLKGASFRGALLIASDLRYADLRKVDFIGADLRDADLSFANLTDCLFLTQSQINSAKGNSKTLLPSDLEKPKHWLN